MSTSALYFVLATSLGRKDCSWKKEWFELTATGKLTSISEYEDKVIYRSEGFMLSLMVGVKACSAADYAGALARCLAAEEKDREQVQRDKEARSVLKAQPTLGDDLLADFTVFDCETTGFSAAGDDRLLELAAVRYREGKACEQFQSFVRCTRDIPFKVQQLTGITPQLVRQAPESKQVLQSFRALAEGSLLVGHNVTFDIRFVNAERMRLGATAELSNPFLCTQVVAASRYPGPHKLGDLCGRFGIPNDGAHRALNDVLMTGALLLHMHAEQPITPELVNATSAAKFKKKAKAAAQPTLDFAA
jgi:DNA polymerase-3 subunit epsilon